MKQIYSLVTLSAVVASALVLAQVHANPPTPAKASGAFVVKGLRWETSFGAAKALAAREKRPILHLQSFGKPGDPMACTNTRILTETLLNDAEFKELAQGSVLSWDLVREAAKVTIDLGNGRKLKRTLRGNTCLYVLRPDGTVVDAFPGVYVVKDLLPELRESLALVDKSPKEVAEWHSQQAVNGRVILRSARIPLAASKAGIETPLLEFPASDEAAGKLRMGGRGGFARASLPPFGSMTAQQKFEFAASQMIDFSSIPMPPSVESELTGVETLETPEERGRELIRLESSVNLTNLRRVIHFYLAAQEAAVTPEQAKPVVFEKILHIDYRDPYLGLNHIKLPGTMD